VSELSLKAAVRDLRRSYSAANWTLVNLPVMVVHRPPGPPSLKAAWRLDHSFADPLCAVIEPLPNLVALTCHLGVVQHSNAGWLWSEAAHAERARLRLRGAFAEFERTMIRQ
jgi:hypothetical protein